MAEYPTDVNAPELIKKIKKKFGFEKYSQKGSHIKLKKDGKQPLTIPNHKPIKLGTLKSIIGQLAGYLGKTPDDVLKELGF